MRAPCHVWTWPQIRFAGECWRAGMSCDRIADALAERFGFIVSKNSIISLSRRHRDLMPIKSAEEVFAARAEGGRRAWERLHGPIRRAA